MSDDLDHALAQLRRQADEGEIQNLRDRLAKAENALYAFGARVSDLERLNRDFKFYFMIIAGFLGVLLLERAYGREAAAQWGEGVAWVVLAAWVVWGIAKGLWSVVRGVFSRGP